MNTTKMSYAKAVSKHIRPAEVSSSSSTTSLKKHPPLKSENLTSSSSGDQQQIAVSSTAITEDEEKWVSKTHIYKLPDELLVYIYLSFRLKILETTLN
jgi:hypothetical protein